ncbi:MAG: short-chain dehydrogenase/reductase [Proteobacteria bacterium]|nr:short-chain dehydrogenase/reductase [Pseudomonadota bacterium]
MNPKITDWRGQRVWLVGASSGIGAALAQLLLARGARVALSARDPGRLASVAGGAANALLLACDVTDEASLESAWKRLLDTWGGVDVAIYLAGDYLPMRAWTLDSAEAQRMIAVNFTGAVSFAACVVAQLLRQGEGQVAFVASVAGYRGLPKALIYGPTKAALINFAEALYLDLEVKGVGVRLINPGFVATALTARNDFSMPALISAEDAALATIEGFAGSAFEIDYPKRFTHLIKLLALLPYRVYFPLVRRLTGG